MHHANEIQKQNKQTHFRKPFCHMTKWNEDDLRHHGDNAS